MISEEYFSANVSNECKVLILCRLLITYLDEASQPSFASLSTLSYKLLVPLWVGGLESASQLENKQSGDAIVQLLDALWEKVCLSLSKMMAPVSNGSMVLTSQHSVDLGELVKAASKNVPKRHQSGLCAIFSSGAANCLEMAKLQNDSSPEETERNQVEFLKLFTTCFSAVCMLQPENSSLLATADHVLSEARRSDLKDSENDDSDSSFNLGVEATLSICRAIRQMNRPETITIFLFPQLCKLVGTEHLELRQAVGEVLALVDVGRVLNEARTRCQHAEKRAEEAEQRAAKLAKEVEELRKAKDALERQVAVF